MNHLLNELFTLLQSRSDDEGLKPDESAEAKDGDEVNPPESKAVSWSLYSSLWDRVLFAYWWVMLNNPIVLYLLMV